MHAGPAASKDERGAAPEIAKAAVTGRLLDEAVGSELS